MGTFLGGPGIGVDIVPSLPSPNQRRQSFSWSTEVLETMLSPETWATRCLFVIFPRFATLPPAAPPLPVPAKSQTDTFWHCNWVSSRCLLRTSPLIHPGGWHWAGSECDLGHLTKRRGWTCWSTVTRIPWWEAWRNPPTIDPTARGMRGLEVWPEGGRRASARTNIAAINNNSPPLGQQRSSREA